MCSPNTYILTAMLACRGLRRRWCCFTFGCSPCGGERGLARPSVVSEFQNYSRRDKNDRGRAGGRNGREKQMAAKRAPPGLKILNQRCRHTFPARPSPSLALQHMYRVIGIHRIGASDEASLPRKALNSGTPCFSLTTLRCGSRVSCPEIAILGRIVCVVASVLLIVATMARRFP